ncbi:DUF4192 family protein [Arcanobacterium bovis]|nr:DUF4192 family protein [Arcanobacterium bovis]
METTLHMQTLAESLLLIPHALGFKPVNALVVSCLLVEQSNEEQNSGMRYVPHGRALTGVEGDTDNDDAFGAIGPMIVLDIQRASSNPLAVASVLETIAEYKAKAVAVCWFGANLNAMAADRRAVECVLNLAMNIHEYLACQSIEDAMLGVFATDYISWIDFDDVNTEYLMGNHGEFDTLISQYGHSYSQLENTELSAELIYAGSALHFKDERAGCEAEGECSDCDIEVRRKAVLRALQEEEQYAAYEGRGSSANKNDSTFDDHSDTCDEHGAHLFGEENAHREVDTLWETVLGDLFRDGRGVGEYFAQLSAPTLAKLIVSLREIHTRDRLIVFAVDGTISAFSATDSAPLSDLLSQATTSTPIASRMDRIIELLMFIDALTPVQDVTAMATISYLYWWLGKGSMAFHTSRLALARKPDYSLAQLVSYAVEARLAPPWM